MKMLCEWRAPIDTSTQNRALMCENFAAVVVVGFTSFGKLQFSLNFQIHILMSLVYIITTIVIQPIIDEVESVAINQPVQVRYFDGIL